MATSLEALIATYGYLAIFVGTFLEGETILVLAGFAAHRGYLSLGGVIAVAIAGSLAGDQLYFWIGRRHGAAWLERRPAWQARMASVRRIFERHRYLLVVGFRFLYGLRTLSPFMLGTTSIGAGWFALLNSVGAILWAAAFSLLGYGLGAAAELVIERLRHYELVVFAAIALTGSGLWLLHRWRETHSHRPPPAA